MLAIETIISRVRNRTHDQHKTGYTDEYILECINDGIRFIRRIIKDYKPLILAEPPISGTLAPGENQVTLAFLLTKLLDLRVSGERIGVTDLANITDTTATGTPYAYYLTGFSTINFYPTPDAAVTYSLVAVGDFTEVALDGKSPFPNDFDDFLIEYAVIRLSAGNEYDMTQETNLIGSILQQIQNNLIGDGNPVNQVSGYFNPLPQDYNCIRVV